MRRYALFGATIFLSAFLLFSLEPLVAKRILPSFGGSAAVWSTCLVFFETALLAGYLYARWLSQLGQVTSQAGIHIAVLLTSLVFLPVSPGKGWLEGTSVHPVWSILVMLTATIGLPFIALSATSPLLQHWLARQGHRTPFQLFAVSNSASLAALVAYPFVVEPALDRSAQRRWWSIGYGVFCVLCAAVAWQSRKHSASIAEARVWHPVRARQLLLWFVLSACGSMLLLAITNHITENIAAVPLLWILPLAVYLISFVLAFGNARFYGRSFWLRLLAVALGMLGYGLYDINTIEAIQVSLPVFLVGLFVCCMFCHGELNRSRPESEHLTDFYLMIAAGGACGAIFVGIISPLIFSGIYELPLTLVLTAALAVLVTWRGGTWPLRVLWIGVTCGMAAVFIADVRAYRENSLSLRRSFYGSLRVVQSRLAGERQTRTLFHGTIEHGSQFLLPPMRFRPTTYYGPDSGIGIVLRECFHGPKRVGVVGLGAGTIAAYGESGDVFRFYEINQQVEDAAQYLFGYLRESHARTELVTGDARISLEHEDLPPFDVLALDAFSGDAIPVHLLTTEAMALYSRHLKKDGVLAFHVSNNYLDLASVVQQLAEGAGYRSMLVRNHENDDEGVLSSDWVIVTRNTIVIENASLAVHRAPMSSRAGLRAWTDDYSNLPQIVKTIQLK